MKEEDNSEVWLHHKESEQDIQIRGTIIYEAISLESKITEIISIFFLPKFHERELFYSIFLHEGRLSFLSKIEILNKLLKDEFPELPGKKIVKKLKKFNNIRNDLAHQMSISIFPYGPWGYDTSDRIIPKGTDFPRSKKKEITFQDRDDCSRKYLELMDQLHKIEEKIIKDICKNRGYDIDDLYDNTDYILEEYLETIQK